MITSATYLIERKMINILSKCRKIRFLISEDRTEESPLLERETKIARWESFPDGIANVWFEDGSSVSFSMNQMMYYSEKANIWIQSEDPDGRYFTLESFAA